MIDFSRDSDKFTIKIKGQMQHFIHEHCYQQNIYLRKCLMYNQRNNSTIRMNIRVHVINQDIKVLE